MKWFSKLKTELRIYSKEIYEFLKNDKIVPRIFSWVLVFSGLIHIHIGFYLTFGDHKTFINNLFVAFFQLTGGGLIITSITSNINEVAKKRLLDPILMPLKNFPRPFRDRSQVMVGADSVLSLKSDIGSMGRKVPESIEERVEFLEKEIQRIESDITKNKKDVQKKFGVFNTTLNDLKNEIENIKNKLEISVTSVEMEVIGILFIGYGILIPVVFN